MRDPGEFMSTLKVDLYPEEVYCFTPTRQGDRAAARRHAHRFRLRHPHRRRPHLRGRQGERPHRAAASTTLRNGDVVEILTQPGHQPSKDWLALVKTSRARNKIKHVINATERAKAIEIGQKYLEKEARRLGVALSRIAKAELERVAGEYGYSKMEDLHAALGYGKFSARQVLQKLAPDLVEPSRRSRQAAHSPPAPAAAPSARRTPAIWSSRSRASTTCWSTAPSAAIRSAARPSSATSRAARASPCTPPIAPTCRT